MIAEPVPASEVPTWPPHRVLAAGLLGVLCSLWTWKLLEPNPVPEQVREFLTWWEWLPFLAAKTLHAAGYGTLTVLAGVAIRGRWAKRCALIYLLLHGVGTEIGQNYVPNRTGRVRDVVIDFLGVAAGVGIGWRAWREAFQPPDLR